MSDIKLRIYYLFFGGIGVALFLSMLSADFQDPTVFNQLYPSEGVQNWAGLIGALIGGSLLEIFGPSALLLPWLFVRAALHQPRQISGLICTYYAFVLVFLLSIIHELALHSGLIKTEALEFYLQNGYAAKLALIWLEKSTNLAISLTVLAAMFIFSLVRMSQIISPLPFISGVFSGVQILLSMLARKISPPPPADNYSTTQLPNFK
ncbi:MAG: DNA translocase FtsK 4TM domain-containing protein [SAR324 cluster bacterium]|nr:DNA translocase FtsK 4TM domain-containing protein [SAR324 cluster bacterium]MEC9337571.1 DNA translocase FtsK 4TM domain-containing protein [SAR324 cluster bacterium]MED5571430.1 DNA translocase FtsK 4TM domain-containing protein [SAR324 cluster bacterium]|tara:strand:- start:158 stop:778 length:621 start_codon:yes stop_codon:yes gene_type:complete